MAPELPIVVLSGEQSEEIAVQAVHEGAQDYLVKRAGHRRAGAALRALRDGAQARAGGAGPPGAARLADRPAQPDPADGPHRAGAGARRANQLARGPAVPGPGPLQAGQRQPGPRRRRPAAVPRGRAPEEPDPPVRHRGPLRRRRVHGAVRPGRGRPPGDPGGRAPQRRAGRAVRAGGPRAVRGRLDRHRVRRRPQRHLDEPDPRRRPGHVPRQGARQPLRDGRRHRLAPRRRAAEHRDPAAPRAGPAASCGSSTSPRWTWPATPSSASRPCCAGSTPTAACSARATS